MLIPIFLSEILLMFFLVFDPFLSKENRSKLNLPQQNDRAKKISLNPQLFLQPLVAV